MQLVAKKFLESKHTYAQYAEIQALMQEKLIKLLDSRSFECIFEFGCGIGNLTHKLSNFLDFKSFICNDINDFGSYLPSCVEFLQFDMNDFISHLHQKKFNLIISNACVQWLKQEHFFLNVPHISKKDTLLVLGSFGKRNLFELRDVLQLGLQYLSLQDYQDMLKEDWEILHLFEEEIPLHFENALDIFRHLKNTGVNSLQQDYKIKKFSLKILETRFHNTITYNPLYIVARKF